MLKSRLVILFLLSLLSVVGADEGAGIAHSKVYFLAPTSFPHKSVEVFDPELETYRTIAVSTRQIGEGLSLKVDQKYELRNGKGTSLGSLQIQTNVAEKSHLVVFYRDTHASQKEYKLSKPYPLALGKLPRGGRTIVNLTSSSAKGEWGVIPFERGAPQNVSISVESMELKILSPPESTAEKLSSQPYYLEFLDGSKVIARMSSRFFYSLNKHSIMVVENVDGQTPQIFSVQKALK